MAKLEVNNLSISFRTTSGAVRAVRDISFKLEEGETLAIAGESGSGKSVTTRAVMGILAGNAMVDGGEIIYDGKDLLKIPEEEFHNLRGHRLAMVFQDPLSALNPTMRIGRQLTEAMLLNNKERRRDGRESFNKMLKILREKMTAAGGIENVDGKIKEFDDFVKIAVKQEFDYEEAKEAVVEAMDCLDEMESALVKHDDKSMDEICDRLLKAMKGIYNPYTVPSQTPEIKALLDKFRELRTVYSISTIKLPSPVLETIARARGKKLLSSAELRTEAEAAHKSLKEILNGILAAEEPNFFCIGYMSLKGQDPGLSKESVPSINQRARKMLDDGFMLSFRKDVEKALAFSEQESLTRKNAAVQALKTALPAFEKNSLEKGETKAALKASAAAVEASIDPLQLDKDSQTYVYRSSMKSLLERYFKSFTQNPKEQKRFKKETDKFNKDTAKGKTPPSVIPMNLIDEEAARKDIDRIASRLKTKLEDQIAAGSQGRYDERAVEMIDYLKARASDYAFRLSKGMARHRAIELMKEVGIPEPHKRYRQYSFEFSGGMRQRIVIAIALSANPDILICDEPTTALDVTIQAQILELINRLKKERKLSVIFITHDLGVVANMADKIAIMYAGKIVEYGTADDVFYDPRHPYTWALLSSMPDLETKEKLEAIPGTPPDMILPPKGDAFAARHRYAMEIDFEQQPPAFQISDTHWAATWLLHPNAPKQEPPAIVRERIERMQKEQAQREQAAKTEGGAEA